MYYSKSINIQLHVHVYADSACKHEHYTFIRSRDIGCTGINYGY